jgi:hypothetical protein
MERGEAKRQGIIKSLRVDMIGSSVLDIGSSKWEAGDGRGDIGHMATHPLNFALPAVAQVRSRCQGHFERKENPHT